MCILYVILSSNGFTTIVERADWNYDLSFVELCYYIVSGFGYSYYQLGIWDVIYL